MSLAEHGNRVLKYSHHIALVFLCIFIVSCSYSVPSDVAMIVGLVLSLVLSFCLALNWRYGGFYMFIGLAIFFGVSMQVVSGGFGVIQFFSFTYGLTMLILFAVKPYVQSFIVPKT